MSASALLASLVPLLATVVLCRVGVPLGCPGRFVYLYSPVELYRLRAVPLTWLAAAALGLGVAWLAADARRRRFAGSLLVAAGGVLLGVWTYFAPPCYFVQHHFNLHTPSHDGAFVGEALRIGTPEFSSLRDYLRQFPDRARRTPAEMRGTRVISNPPGATVLAALAVRLVDRWPGLETLLTRPAADERLPAATQHRVAAGLVFFWLVTGLWLAGGLGLYAAARQSIAPAAAAAYAVCVVFTPATLLLTPGKDPAQLVSVAVPLLLWLVAWRHGSVTAAAGAGLAFVAACAASLVHAWVAAIIVAATVGCIWRSAADLRRVLLRVLLPATGAAILGIIALRCWGGLDLPAAAWAVARAQAEVTRGPQAMPLAWQLLGVPLFLLFAGSAWWAATLGAGSSLLKVLRSVAAGRASGQVASAANPKSRIQNPEWPPSETRAPPLVRSPASPEVRFGRWLLIGSLVVPLLTIGFTNLETPRLWIPFTPLWMLGVLLQLETFRRPNRAVGRWLAVLVIVQVVVAGLQWSLMDMREAETRLVEQRFFG